MRDIPRVDSILGFKRIGVSISLFIARNWLEFYTKVDLKCGEFEFVLVENGNKKIV